jgi:glycosyltransferase involved in cell wall biosynthesis
MAPARASVIVTCYNLGGYLLETVESIRAQTFKAFEVCIVDDGSTEPATLRVLDDLSDEFNVVRTYNRGLSAARNLGLSMTSGEYVCAVDSDDILRPNLLERSVSYLDEHPSLSFASHWLETFGDQNWEWTPTECDLATLLDFNSVNGAAVIRRSALQDVGGWDEKLTDGCEDWDLWISLVKRGYAGAIIPEILFRYRRRPDSMSRIKFAGAGHARVYQRLVEKHIEAYEQHAPALAAKRTALTAMNTALADDLEERAELEWVPALQRARDDLSDVEETYERDQQLKQGRTAMEHLERLLAESQTHASALEQEIRNFEDSVGSLQAEVAALRNSWSWRLTLPVRVVAGWLRYFTRQ